MEGFIVAGAVSSYSNAIDSYLIYCIVVLAIAAGLAFIPANIARDKGYSFGLWWFYGWMLFIVAIIHVSLIPNKNSLQQISSSAAGQSVADELKKYKELQEQGIITEEEFQAKKAQLLKLM